MADPYLEQQVICPACKKQFTFDGYTHCQECRVPDAPTTKSDGEPMQEYEVALTVILKTHGLDASEAARRAMMALGIPGGPFPHTIDHVSHDGPHFGAGGIVTFHADVRHAQAIMTREVDDRIRPMYEGDEE